MEQQAGCISHVQDFCWRVYHSRRMASKPFAVITAGPSCTFTAWPSLGSPHLMLPVMSICAALASPHLSCTSLPPFLFVTHPLQLGNALWVVAQKLQVLFFFHCNLFTWWKTIKFQKVLFIPEIWFYLPQHHSSFVPAIASFFLTLLSKASSAVWEPRG